MKSLKEYLLESKKVYGFKVKVAGELPEKFQEHLKASLEKYQIVTLEHMSTPVQEYPMDFPELTNKEINIFDLVVEYPITAPEISNFIKDIGLTEECFRVRGSGEPSEIDQLSLDDEPTGVSLLSDPFYTETENAKHKDYFGDDFNKNFLKELSKIAKERSKELGHDKADANVLESSPSYKTDKKGTKSAIGS
jgi:hypothetical protein